MIQVDNLIKEYGSFRAIDDISFQINKGEIVGLLGPNGAGKTSIMRIITGYLSATYGSVKIDGMDIDQHSKEIKKRIGYLPENAPIYPEMTVTDFLKSMAELKGMRGKELSKGLDNVIESVKIGDKRKSIIGTLSKGYKQRVCLAQALIHNPEILILDEPTVGLDPNQIIEIRDLIRGLREDRTIILSTHILPEVSQTCERIIIISRGKVVAQNSESELIKQFADEHKLYISVTGDVNKAMELIKEVDETLATDHIDDHIEVAFDDRKDLRADIAKKLINNGIDLLELRKEKVTLEEIFIRLTQEN